MKQLLLIPLLFSFSPVAFAGDSQRGWSHQEKCYKTVYREEYVPGTMKNPGYVKSYKERVKVPCEDTSHHIPSPSNDIDDNSCVEGSIIGGILGGAAGGTLATKKNWIWSIPAGVVGGAMVGCQVDGG